MDIIQCSGAPILKQYLDIASRGYKAVEVHLMQQGSADVIQILKECNLDCYTVHTPILKNGETYLHQMHNTDRVSAIEESASLANQIAEQYSHDVGIVIHNSWDLEEYRAAPDLYKTIVAFLTDLHKRFPYVRFLLENVTPMRRDGRFRNGIWLSEMSQLVYWLVVDSGIDNIGICFDLCHYYTTRRICQCIMAESSGCISDELQKSTRLDILAEVEDAINEVHALHISDVVGLGDEPGTHGTPLTQSSKEDLLDILGLFAKKKHKLPICTVEMYEDDFTKCVNAGEALPFMEHVMKEAYN